MKAAFIYANTLAIAALCTEAFVAKTTTHVRAPNFSSPRMANVAPDAKYEETTVCLITGASRGIGRCIAKELNDAGKNVKIIVNDIEPMKDEAEKVCQEIRDAGGDAIAITADCSKREEIKAMFKEAVDKYGKVDVLVNNAGIARDGLMVRMKPEQWQQVIDINLSGVFYTSQEFLKRAIKRNSGCIINMASVVGQIGNPGQANYSAAKAGVIGLTKSNAKEYASKGIRVNAVCPGFIATPMTASLGEEFLAEMAEKIPLGRLGEPEEVAGTVRFLALDPAARYMTGHCYNVDGGIAINTA